MESIGILLEEGILRMGVIGGAVLGAVLGPAAAWMLMRHVPLWMAIGGTAAGTPAGAMASLVIPQAFFFSTLAGFGAAALWMRLRVPRDPRRTALPARGEWAGRWSISTET